MSEPRTLAARGSDWCQEASVLVLVFGFLDTLLAKQAPTPPTLKERFQAVEIKWAVLVVLLSIGLFFAGWSIEHVRLGKMDGPKVVPRDPPREGGEGGS